MLSIRPKSIKKRDRPLSVDGLQNQKPKFMKPFTNNVNSLDRELWMYIVTHCKDTHFFLYM